MKLGKYLESRDISFADFGRRIGKSRSAVARYCNGLRTPDRKTMPRIIAETAGEVTANDFVDMVDAPAPQVAA